jgi:hypothetical protein
MSSDTAREQAQQQEHEQEHMCHKRNGLWIITGPDRPRVYEDVALALAFGDPTSRHHRDHSVCVAGRREDNVVEIFHGYTGYLSDVLREAVNFKDAYWVTRGYVSREPETLIREARNTDGLCRYDKAQGQLRSSRPRYRNPPETWPHFRSRTQVLALIRTPPHLWEEFPAACVTFEGRLNAGQVELTRRRWPALLRIVRSDPDQAVGSSVLRAAVYAADRLLAAQRPAGPTPEPPPVYRPLRR